MSRLLYNIFAFYIGWFACVLGAGRDRTWLGPVVVGLLLLAHLKIHRPWKAELSLAGICFILGFLFDTLLVQAGVMSVKPDLFPAGFTSLWMAAMWVNFGLTLNVSLKFLQQRMLWAVLLGFAGGPAAYYTGERLGAVEILSPLGINLLFIGLVWGAITPLLCLSARVLKIKYSGDRVSWSQVVDCVLEALKK